MKVTLFLVLLFCIYSLASNPLTNCGGGRGVPYTLAGSGGACNLPTVGIPPANVDETFFANGAKCGSCYEVTGPLGTQVVQIFDKCPASTGTGECTGDKVQFGIDDSTLSLMVERNGSNSVLDLGFREVTCPVVGNVKIQATSTASIEYYFRLLIWNFRVGLTDVRVKASGWSTYEQMKREGTSGAWTWNKNQNAMKFPVSFYLVGTTQELLTVSVNELVQGSTVDFGDQFTNVASMDATCPLFSSPAVVYEDSVATGWDTSYTFQRSYLKNEDTTSPYSGTSCISVGLYQYGGLLFTRTGGFNPLYFSYLTFAAIANSNSNVKVYIGDGTVKYATIAVSTQWTIFNISVDTLTTNSVESTLAFLNLESNVAELRFDSIRWEVASITPLDKVPPVEKPGGGLDFVDDATTGVVFVDTTTTGFSFSSEEPHSSSTSAGIVPIISTIAFILCSSLALL